jgi:hypothetical protein
MMQQQQNLHSMHERHAAQKTRAVCGFLPAGLPEYSAVHYEADFL